MAGTQFSSCARRQEQSQDENEDHENGPMIDRVHLRAWASAQSECSDPQKDARHCKDMRGDSSLPGPTLADEHGVGTNRQEDPAETLDNCGRNDLRLRETQ